MKAFTSDWTMCLVTILLLFASNVANATHEGGHADTGKSLFTKHFQNTLFDITEHGSYSAEILLDDREYKIGKNVIGIVIHNNNDEDVKGAKITFVLKNLLTGENSDTSPVVADKGNGLYIVSGLDLKREGKWELGITVKKGRIEDHLKFIFPEALKKLLPKGRYSP